MGEVFLVLLYAGGMAGAELAGQGLWRQLFWPYYAGKALACFAFANGP
jgi:hypothetical protein